jgi:putative salt-induced outer membrane protein YdiY
MQSYPWQSRFPIKTGGTPMQRWNAILALAAFLSCLFMASIARADEVVMGNGDRITGTILSKDEQVLVIKTDYAGEVKIRWIDVARLQSNEPVWIYLKDGSKLHGRLVMGEDKTLSIDAGDNMKSGALPVADVQYINPPPELSGEGVKLTGHANLGYASSSGNTDTEKWYVDFEAVARTRDNRYTVGGEARRAEDNGIETESNWLGFMKYDHFLSKKWYAYANGNFENDEFKDIRLRTTLGVGSGYQFVEDPRKNLSLEGGVSYVNTDFDVAEDDSYPAGRVAIKYDQFLFRTNVQFFHTDETYVDLQDAENVFLRTSTGFRFPLVSRLNATVQYDYDWENQPAPGRVKDDQTVRATLGVTW